MDRIRHWLMGEPSKPTPLPPELREASHKQANQAAAVRATLHRLSLKEDPIESLVDALHGMKRR